MIHQFGTTAVDPQPGDVVWCNAKGCKRKTKIKRDGTVANHYWLGRNRCDQSGKEYGTVEHATEHR